MKKVLVMSLLALVVMTMSSCLRVKIGENGWSLINKAGHRNDTPTQVHQVNEVTQMQQFDELDVAGPFNVILEQGQASTVRVEGTVDQLGNMTIYVKDGDLVIDMKEDMVDASKFFDGLRVFVSSPMVKDIEIAGSGSVTAPQALAVNELNLEIAGSGDITLAQLTSKNLYMEIAGSGDITLGTVQANEARSEIAGSGNIEVASLTCKKANNEIAGSGDITLNNLNVDHVKSEIAGSGNVILRGKVGSHDEEIAGSGKVNVSGLKN
ncbi:MAG: DUF2807 domain-containing protein [Muribaculaceae bacterium]|nr:DUF2807 domain-containing protein [Muribaculaceae bacterium]